MKYQENCISCKEKENCKQYRPVDLQETIDCIALHGAASICRRSNFKKPALHAVCVKAPHGIRIPAVLR